MPAAEKKFVLTHVIKDVMSLEEGVNHYSPTEEHFNLTWQMYAVRNNDRFGLFLRCENQTKNESSVTTACYLRLLAMNGKTRSDSYRHCFKHTYSKHDDSFGCQTLISWQDMKNFYMIDGNVIIQADVNISKMTGIEKKKLRNFNESMKNISDVVLVVDDEKFYVSKLTLAAQSTYFEALFLRKFEESEKSEITLKDIVSKDFQHLLELLYGESSIDDETVAELLKLADMYDAKLAIRKCEEFLIKESDKTLKEKLQMAKTYSLEKLKNGCLSKINNATEIRSVLPYDTIEMDPSVVRELFRKALSLLS